MLQEAPEAERAGTGLAAPCSVGCLPGLGKSWQDLGTHNDALGTG